MITDKARELSAQAKAATDPAEAQRLANEFYEELFTNCMPTEDEWAEVSSGVRLTDRGLWKLIEHIAQRQAFGM